MSNREMKGGDSCSILDTIQQRISKRKVKTMYYREMPKFKPEEILDYLRKSQSDDPLLTVEEVLAKHERILDEWDERNLDGKVPEENRFREVVSGETLADRPEINKVLRMIESPKYKAVKVVEPQRLTRGDLEDIGRLMKLLKFTNTFVITPERIYDLRDEYDWNAFEAELKRGNDYLKYAKKILERGRLLSVSSGNFISSIPPYGFDKTFVMDGKRKCPTLKENKAQADVVRLIFDLYVNKDMGKHKICTTLEEMAIKPPKGLHWSPSAIKDMLENVHYIGKVKWNWRKTIQIVEESEIIKTRPKAKIGEYLVFNGKHDAIVSEELFQKAREKQGKNPPVPTNRKMRNPLAGLIYCRCGRAMSLHFIRNKKGKDKCQPRLICPEQKYCNTGSCIFDEVIERVCDVLKQCIADFEVRIENNEGDSAKLHASLIKGLEKRMEELQAQELSQWELQSHPDESQRMPPHIFKQLNEKLLKDKEELQQALCKAYESMPEPVDYEERIVRFTEALEVLKNPDVDIIKKNMLLKECIERIEYSRERPKRQHFKGTFAGQNPWTEEPINLDVKLKV